MRHESQILEGSIEHTSVDGIAFTARCCDDATTDHRVHLQDAAFLDASELRMKLEQLLIEHAESHMRACGAKLHLESLTGGKITGCCGRDTE